ncbi:MAG: transporter substrate-binding domain-containing protein [Anaerolineae bacterium]|nr:transporter substrate-binding domain-containing protein [Anaerolineae bacterium]
MLLVSCATLLPAVSIALPAQSETPVVAVPSVAPPSDPVWDRIVANNKIVIGTAWDYPPFASVDSNFQVVGFDTALIEEIGKRLNIPIEVQNFSFEGLPGALQIDQIDLAVAAVSITPERASQMAFSPVYYVNQTAILARSDSMSSITDFNQLAAFRVGVQRGSTYESMLQTQLVDTGLMSADKLLSYVQADEAIRDLQAKRVDLVVIGQATARHYNAQYDGLKIVGKGFEQQDLAIAMRLETPRLKAEIDRVMDDMLTDGTMLSLIQQYIQSDVSDVLPTPRPTNLPAATVLLPVSTATPPKCWDGMKFVADITYPDNNMKNPPFVKPGGGFVKTWRVQNTGTCTWTPKYRLVYAYGNVTGAQMNGQPVNIVGNVLPGQTIDLSVTLIAPQEALTYQGFWQIENIDARRFGQTIWVGITTQSEAETPPSTAQPPSGNYCQVTLTAPRDSVTVKSSFDAVWTVKNISGADWSSDSFDYKYISGTEMHEKAVYDFAQTVQDGESIKIIVDMLAPPTPGIYNTRWAIVSGSKTLCILALSVTVEPQ